MNPFLYFLTELEQDKSDDTLSTVFRFLLPYWRDEWDESPVSYRHVFEHISQKVETLPDLPLTRKLLSHLNFLVGQRPWHPYTVPEDVE